MFGPTIAKLRKQRRLTQAKLADEIHVTQAAVSQWETGRTYPDHQQLFILANYFGVTVEALSTGNLSAGLPETKNAPTSDDSRAEARRLLENMDEEQYQAALQYLKFLQSQKAET